MKILSENVGRNIMNKLNENARNKWQIPENLKVVDINMTNDPHGTCIGKFNDGTWFVSGNGSIGVYDADPASAYGFNNEYDEDYYMNNADNIVRDFNDKHLLAEFEVDINNRKYSDYDKIYDLIYNNLNEAWEPENLELDENGLPVLDGPYNMRWVGDDEYEDGYYIITSVRPYNDAEYSHAKTKEPDYTSYWYVYGPDGKQAGVVEGYDEAVELMKELDKDIKPRMVHN